MNPSSELWFFLGRFHPLLVHLPIGLIVLLVFLEVASRFKRFKDANMNNGLILALAVPLSAVTAFVGWLLSREGGYNQRLLDLHFWTGIATAGVLALAALLYWFNWRNLYRVFLFASFGVLLVASHFGGSLTHGSDYLVRYAPATLKNMLLARTAKPVPRPAVPAPVAAEEKHAAEKQSTWQSQPVFAVAIQPILDDKCVACHGPDKSKGGLRLDSFEALSAGGDYGPSIIAGKSSESELIKRLELPLDHDEHMPPDGKPQPTADEITLLKWWVDSGSSSNELIADLTLTPAVTRILTARFGAPAPEANVVAVVEPGSQPKTNSEMSELVARLSGELEIPITFLGENEPWILCNAGVAGKRFGDNELRTLTALGANLRWLDLAGTAITDAGLGELKPFANLTRLHLERTGVTDEGLAHLASLAHLEYLNLHSTGVSDKGVAHLQEVPRLRKLYLWQTKATPAGAEAFTAAKYDKEQVRQWEAEIERLKTLIKNNQITVDLGVTSIQKLAAQAPINKECPVSGKAVDPGIESTYEGKTVAFCCPDCKAKFDGDPKPFLAKLGLSPETKPATEAATQKPINSECPVSGKPVDSSQTSAYSGKTVAFCCADCKKKFDEDPKPFLAKLGLSK